MGSPTHNLWHTNVSILFGNPKQAIASLGPEIKACQSNVGSLKTGEAPTSRDPPSVSTPGPVGATFGLGLAQDLQDHPQKVGAKTFRQKSVTPVGQFF